jgi:hypothetical protein
MFQKQANESALPGLQLFASALKRRFHQRAGCDIRWLQIL